VNIFRS